MIPARIDFGRLRIVEAARSAELTARAPHSKPRVKQPPEFVRVAEWGSWRGDLPATWLKLHAMKGIAMKNAFWAVIWSLAAATACLAQENDAGIRQISTEPSLPAPLPGAPRSSSFGMVSFSATQAAAAPKPAPRSVPPRTRGEFERWQFGFGYTYIRFRSAPITANLNGFNTSVAYMLDRRFGIEGSVTAAFSTELAGFAREHAKFLDYMAGPRFLWPREGWEPWVHVLAGGAHLQPQTVSGGRNAFGYAAGGGADFGLRPGLIVRVQGNWLGTRFFGETQNHFQLAAGFLLRL